MGLTILECDAEHCLAKRIYPDRVEPYDGGFLYRATVVPCSDFGGLAEVVTGLVGEPGLCVLRDTPIQPGVWTPRRAIEYTREAAGWLCLDADETTVPFDLADPGASAAAWRATLPDGLSEAACLFVYSAQAHLSPTVRGHGWFWLDRPVSGGPALKAWLVRHGFDGSLADAVHVHYTAAPVFVGCEDPLAGRRVHRFDGGLGRVDLTEGPPPTTAPSRTDVQVTGAAGLTDRASAVLALLPPASECDGQKFAICGALGGIARAALWDAAEAEALVRAWTDGYRRGDEGIHWALGAWGKPFDGPLAGRADLALYVGQDRADAIARAAAPAGVFGWALAGGAIEADPSGQPLTLSGANHQMWILVDGRYRGPYSHHAIKKVAGSRGLGELVCIGRDGKSLTYDTIYDRGTHVETVVRSFAETGAWFDAPREELHQGYVLPDTPAAFDPDVDAWLRVLTGELYPQAEQWIASCAQRYMNRPAAAFVIVGPPGVGKTQLFRALAHLWGARQFVHLSESVAQFNGSITRCPIVVDDECKALKRRLVSSAEFRERVQADDRSFELKGKEKITLLGCTREAITGNDLGEVALTDVRGQGVVKALTDRLLVVQAPEAASAALQAVRGNRTRAEEIERIASHLAWLWETVDLPEDPGRFIGAGGVGAESIALGEVAESGGPLWDSLDRFLQTVQGESTAAGPWIVHLGQVWASPGALALEVSLTHPGWDVVRVTRLVRPIATGPAKRIFFGGKDRVRARYWPIDLEKALRLIG